MKSYYDNELFDRLEQYVAKQKDDLIYDFPLLRIQLAFFLGKFQGNKFDVNAIFNEVKYKRLPFNFGSFARLVKLRILLVMLNLYNRKLLKNKVLLFGYTSHYNRQEDGTELNLYLSPLKDELRSIKIEFEELLMQRTRFDINLTRLKVYYDILFEYNTLLFSFKAKLFNKYKQYIKKAELIKKFLIESNVPKHEHCVTTYYSTRIDQEIIYNTFNQLLKVTKPKLVWTYVYYDNDALALCRAANKHGIPVVEYQHSQQSDFHFAYAKWNKMESYSQYFPSVFWVWSDEDKERIQKNFFAKGYRPRIVAGGNLAVIQKKQLFNYKEPSASNGILISLAGEWIPEFLEKIIAKDNKYMWYFRLHPRYPQDKQLLMEFKNKFPEKIEIDKANNLPLYQLFTFVNVNITNSSGTALEAEHFKIHNIIASDRGRIIYKDKIAEGKFLSVANELELSAILYSGTLDKNGSENSDSILNEKEQITKGLLNLLK